MSLDNSLQLRILTGLHAGARAPLDGGDLLIGSAEGCDIVLADDGLLPCHARLAAGEDGCWLLHWFPEEEDALPFAAPVELARGMSVALGPVIVAIDGADAPWPTLEQLVLAPSSGVFVPPPAEEPVTQPLSDELPEVGEPAVPAPPGSAWQRRARWAGLALAGLALMVVPLAFIAWTSPPAAGHAQPVLVVDKPQPHPAVAAQRAAIEGILGSLGLARHAAIEPKDGGWLVRASYVDDASAEKLLAALSQLKPRPQMRLTGEQDLPQDVADTLARLMRDGSGAVKSVYAGEGRMRLEGRMASAADRDRLLAALQEAYPQVRDWDARVLVREEAGEQLLQELRASGFDDISGSWDGGTFVMDVRLQQAQVPQWERALAQAMGRHNLPMRAALSFTNPAASADTAAARLPFQVRSVVGGDAPYVVLAGGGRLQPDGNHMGWRLRAVEAQRVVFDNGNQRAVIPR